MVYSFYVFFLSVFPAVGQASHRFDTVKSLLVVQLKKTKQKNNNGWEYDLGITTIIRFY